VRASAQMISYEAALGLTVVTVVLESHGLSTRAIVESQAQYFWHWNALRLWVVPLAIFFVAGTAEINRPPFDLAEGDTELGGGFHTEYSSMRFAMFYLAEYMNTITMSAVVVTLFLGGPDGPGLHVVRWLWPILWFLGKLLVLLYVQVWIRAALPRLRYDQLMNLGWKWLIPLSLGWLLLVSADQISRDSGLAVFAGIIVAAVALARARTTARLRRERLAAGPAGKPPGDGGLIALEFTDRSPVEG